MKKKLFEKKIIEGMFSFVLAIVLISASFQACQKDEFLPNTDSETEFNQSNLLKSATISTGDIDALIVKIEQLWAKYNSLESGWANAFIVKLENAKKSLEKGNEKAAVNQLHALLNQLEDLLSDGTIETSIGELIIFDLKAMAGENPIFTDLRDNHEYKTIKIGDQVWMAEDLAYNTLSGSVTSYYGAHLYTWDAAKDACPFGWHLPSYDEWNNLCEFLINNGYAYGGSSDIMIAKALAATNHWYPSDTEGAPGNDMLSNNSSGFSGLPGGIYFEGMPSLYLISKVGNWWTSTVEDDGHIFCMNLQYNLPYYQYKEVYPNILISVRCIRD